MKKRYYGFGALILLMLIISGVNSNAAKAEESLKVKLGTIIDLGEDGDSYKSSDESIVYVSSTGRVTGKKKGTAVITIKKNGKTSKKMVTVTANGKKKDIHVCVDEIAIKKNKVAITKNEEKKADTSTGSAVTVDSSITADSANAYKLTVKLKNTSKKDAKKVILEGRLFGKKVKLDFGVIKAGKTDTVTKTGMTKKEVAVFEPVRIYVYSKSMVSVYNYETGNLVYKYGTVDTTAPVISGFIGKNSHNDGIPYQIVYKGEKHNYLDFIEVEDDRDGKVKVTVDTSKVNFDKKGTYVITYKAVDAEGNIAKATAKVGVRLAGEQADTYAAIILEDIIKDSWSAEKKARAIYKYVDNNIAYTGNSNKSSWEKEAVNGLLNGRGDCFTYYAVSRLLLTRAGVPNIEIRRVQGHGNHWWNMVSIDGELYHFDTCPRKGGGDFCLVTDKQLTGYSKTHGNSHIWDYEKKPKSATKVISSIF